MKPFRSAPVPAVHAVERRFRKPTLDGRDLTGRRPAAPHCRAVSDNGPVPLSADLLL
jgi:hypothetical protein